MYPALTGRLSLNIKNISTASMNDSQRYGTTDQYRYFLNCRGLCFPRSGYRQTEDERSDIILKKGETKNNSNSTRALIGHKPFYMSAYKHGFRSSFISYFIKEM